MPYSDSICLQDRQDAMMERERLAALTVSAITKANALTLELQKLEEEEEMRQTAQEVLAEAHDKNKALSAKPEGHDVLGVAETAIASGLPELIAESCNVSSAFAKKIEMKDKYEKHQYGASGPVVCSIERLHDQMRQTHQLLLHPVRFLPWNVRFPTS
ncbi:hypothetical protein MMC22_004580 [Lobaria immixta]|nr:hypothetical protein [Lobaria immixta]